MALFISLIIRLFSLVFLARAVFFSHNKSAEIVFWLVFSAKRTGQWSYCMGYFKLFLEQLFDAAFFYDNAFYRVYVWTDARLCWAYGPGLIGATPLMPSPFKKKFGHFHWDWPTSRSTPLRLTHASRANPPSAMHPSMSRVARRPHLVPRVARCPRLALYSPTPASRSLQWAVASRWANVATVYFMHFRYMLHMFHLMLQK